MPESIVFGDAAASDCEAVAALHADSWRRFYRGAYSDEFLDKDVLADRRAVWSTRLTSSSPASRTIIAAHEGQLVGFVHVVLDDDPVYGSLIDNLHVLHSEQRRGIGSHLILRAAAAIADSARRPTFYLWVLEQNVDAQRFYQRHGATCAGRTLVQPPGGIASRLNGTPAKLRYVWTDVEAVQSKHVDDADTGRVPDEGTISAR